MQITKEKSKRRRRIGKLGFGPPQYMSLSLSLCLYLSLYGCLGFLAVKSSIYSKTPLKIAFEFKICRNSLFCRLWSRSVSDVDRDHLSWSRAIMKLDRDPLKFWNILTLAWSQSVTAFTPEMSFSSSFRSCFRSNLW